MDSTSPNPPTPPCSAVSAPPIPKWQPSTHPRGRPRQKRYHNKSRDGCLICKRRRIKCDESRPACSLCLKSGFKCLYPREASTLPVVLYNGPACLLPKQSDRLHVDFFLDTSLSLLSLVPGPLVSPALSNESHMKFAKFWGDLVVPMAHTEPQILELVSLFARRHRMALTTAQSDVSGYLRMISVMSKIVESASNDIALVGAMIVFAYERLHSASSGEEPADRSHVHYDAVMRLLPNSSPEVVSSLVPVLSATWAMIMYCTKIERIGRVQVPDRFHDCRHARVWFFRVLKSSDMKLGLAKWTGVALQYYEGVRGRDWEQSKAMLAMLSEAQLFRTALDLSTGDHSRTDIPLAEDLDDSTFVIYDERLLQQHEPS